MAKKYQKRGLENFFLGTIRICSYLILFTPLIVNSNFFFPFIAPKNLYFMALSQIIFFFWLALIFVNSKYKPKFNLLLLGLLIYLFSFTFSSIFGVNPSYSFWSKYERMSGLLIQLHLFGFFLALSSTFNEEDFKKFFAFSIILAIWAGIYAVYKVDNQTMRGGGYLGNESFLGTYLLFNCFFAIYLFFKSTDNLKKVFFACFLLLLILLLLAGVSLKNLSFSEAIFAILFKTGARAAKISLYGGLIFLFLFWLVFSKRKVLKILGISILLPSVILISFALYSIMFLPHSYFRQLLEKEVGSFGGRFFVWGIAKKGFFEKPIFGWGPENFEYAFYKYYNPCFGTEPCGYDTWYDRAHNIVFDTLVTTGFLGLISYFLLFFAIFILLWKNFAKDKINFWPFGIFVSLFIAYFIQNLTVFDMISSSLMLFLSFAFIASFERKEDEEEEKRNPSPGFVFLAIILFFLSFLYFIFFPFLSNTALISAIKKEPFSKERIALYKKATSLSSLGKFQIRQKFAQEAQMSIENLFSRQKDSSQFIPLGAKEELEISIKDLQDNIRQCSQDYRSYLMLGQLLTYFSIFDKTKIIEAEKILQKAIELSPKNQKGYLVLAQNVFYQGKTEEALSLVQRAIDLEPNLPDSYLVFLKIAAAAEKTELIKEKYEIIKSNPALLRVKEELKDLDK